MIKVLIVDDQELIRQSLTVVLNVSSGIEVVDIADSGDEALKKVAACKPDVVLMDIRMPGMDGVETTRLIKERYPHIKFIVLTTFDDDEYVFGALKHGASGYLLKGSGVAELAEAIRIAHSGGAMINPDIASKVLGLCACLSSMPGLGGTVFGNYTLGRPLIGGLVCGLILGNVPMGVMLGAAVQIVYIALVTPGGTVSADVRAISYIGIPLAMLYVSSTGLDPAGTEAAGFAVSMAATVGTLGTVLFYGTATVNLVWQHMGLAWVKQGQLRKLYLVDMVLPRISHILCSFIPTFIVRSGDIFLEVLTKGVSKLTAMERLREHYHVDMEQIVAIGDYYVDIGMISHAGLGIAMGNAPDEVKKAAERTTASNDEEGVYLALKTLKFTPLVTDAEE